MSEHDRWQDAAATYALGALPEDERAAFEAHLAGCAACREELDELRVAAEALPVAAPPMRPPPALKARIMAEVEREAELLRSAGPAADRPAPGRRRRGFAWPSFRFPTPAVAALACAALLVGLGAGAWLFGSSGGRTVDFQRSGALSANASAELEVNGDTAVLVARGLPAPPAGRVYQVWLQRPGQMPEPTAALFTPRRDGSATASVGDVKGVDKVMVSSEPRGGSPAPTTTPILTATVT
jgi:anti-sigma-K factor RskA